MTLLELRTRFISRLNRDDCTAALADGFIRESNDRIGRELRVRFTETSLEVLAPTEAVSTIAVPADYAQTVDIIVDDRPLDRTSYRELLAMGPNGTAWAARHYARQGATFYLRGPIPLGGVGVLIYHAKPATLSSDADTNTVTINCPDLLMYGALAVAGDHFEHAKTAEWEGRYAALMNQLMGESANEEITGGPLAVSSMYVDPGTG